MINEQWIGRILLNQRPRPSARAALDRAQARHSALGLSAITIIAMDRPAQIEGESRVPAIRIYSWSGVFGALDPADQTVAAQLVAAGGAVAATAPQIATRLGAARLVVLLRNQGSDRIIGVASLKNPAPAYRAGRFELAGVPLKGFETAPELGYVAVAEDMRRQGHSERLVGLVLDAVAEPAYATTDDDYMMRTLGKAGFERVGSEWEGERGLLSLWTYALVATRPG